MKKIICLIFTIIFFTSISFAGNVKYGYNAKGQYVPTSIDGKRVKYGYNAKGE